MWKMTDGVLKPSWCLGEASHKCRQMKGLWASIRMQWRPRLAPKCLSEQPECPGTFAIPMVQCSPFQPGLHSHLPSLQVPCSAQRGWQARWSHAAPIQPSSQRQVPPTQTPWPPQSAAQISVGEKEGQGGRGGRRENKSLLSQLLLGTGVTLGHLVRLCERWGFQRLGRVISTGNDLEGAAFGRGPPALASSPE